MLNFVRGNNEIKLSTIGDYFIEWHRKASSIVQLNNADALLSELDSENDDDDQESENCEQSFHIDSLFSVKTRLVLPEINVEFFPFFVRSELPMFGCLNENLTIIYTIENRTESQMLDFECSLDENEYFSISGKKLVIIIIFLKVFSF